MRPAWTEEQRRARAYLDALHDQRSGVYQRIDQIRRLREDAQTVRGSRPREGSRSTGPSDHLGAAAARIADLEADLDRAFLEYIEADSAAVDQLSQLDPAQSRILSLHYLDGRTFEAIADDTARSLRGVHALHVKGLQALGERLTRPPV